MLTVRSATDCVNPKCKLIQTKNSWLALRSQRLCEVTEVAVLLQLLSGSHARLNLAFISRTYADALACFPQSGVLFWGILRGTAPHRAVCCMTQDYWCAVWLHLSGSYEVSSCCMWSLNMSHWVRLLRPYYWQNLLKQGDSLDLHDALNHKFKIETWVTVTTKHCKHTGVSPRDITATANTQENSSSHWKSTVYHQPLFKQPLPW